MATVNCPYEDCDFLLEVENMEDGEQFECPSCGGYLECMNEGTILIIVDDEDVDAFDEELEEGEEE